MNTSLRANCVQYYLHTYTTLSAKMCGGAVCRTMSTSTLKVGRARWLEHRNNKRFGTQALALLLFRFVIISMLYVCDLPCIVRLMMLLFFMFV